MSRNAVELDFDMEPASPRHGSQDSSPLDETQDDEPFVRAKGGPDDRYHCCDFIADGTYKSVYRGVDTELAFEVAWLQLKGNKVSASQRRTFEREVSLLKSLHHPNVLKFYDSWIEKSGHVVLITEFMSSGTLREFLERTGVPRIRVLQGWCKQTLKGLQYLHTRKPCLVHRDIKGDNIFIDGASGKVKIGDMGLACVCSPDGFASSLIGTPGYMAPEMYVDKYTCSVDIFAFGMTVLEIMTLDDPFSECNHELQIYERMKQNLPPKALAKVSNKAVVDFIQKCIAYDATERATIKQLLSHNLLTMTVEREKSAPATTAVVPPPMSATTTTKEEEEPIVSPPPVDGGGGGSTSTSTSNTPNSTPSCPRRTTISSIWAQAENSDPLLRAITAAEEAVLQSNEHAAALDNLLAVQAQERKSLLMQVNTLLKQQAEDVIALQRRMSLSQLDDPHPPADPQQPSAANAAPTAAERLGDATKHDRQLSTPSPPPQAPQTIPASLPSAEHINGCHTTEPMQQHVAAAQPRTSQSSERASRSPVSVALERTGNATRPHPSQQRSQSVSPQRRDKSQPQVQKSASAASLCRTSSDTDICRLQRTPSSPPVSRDTRSSEDPLNAGPRERRASTLSTLTRQELKMAAASATAAVSQQRQQDDDNRPKANPQAVLNTNALADRMLNNFALGKNNPAADAPLKSATAGATHDLRHKSPSLFELASQRPQAWNGRAAPQPTVAMPTPMMQQVQQPQHQQQQQQQMRFQQQPHHQTQQQQQQPAWTQQFSS